MPEPYPLTFTARQVEQLRNCLTAALKSPNVGLIESRQIIEADLNICNQVKLHDNPPPPPPPEPPPAA